MNELKVFSSTEFGELGVMLIDGKEYFPATHCAKILGYSDPFKAIKLHCKSEGWVNCPVLTNGGTQQVKFISEGNLYRLIVSSKLPQAEKFERWVFDEVLPLIRRSGGYIGNAEELIAKTATAVVSGVIKQILPIIASSDVQTVNEIDASEYVYKGPTKCIIETLDENLRAQVDKMIISRRYSYQGIADFLRDNGIKISFASVRNYALRHCGITKHSRTVSVQVSLDELKED